MFESWFHQAHETAVHEPNAMTLSTISATGFPSQRTVLLKSFDQSGFTFFTNYNSPKASEIAANPSVSLLFPWLTLERQVIVRGAASKTTREESAAYFHSRPRESQLGAWVSDQSSPIPSRDFLTGKLAELQARFKNLEIPIPPFWGGYRAAPVSVEFWQGGAARIHDRFLYTKSGETWDIQRLSP